MRALFVPANVQESIEYLTIEGDTSLEQLAEVQKLIGLRQTESQPPPRFKVYAEQVRSQLMGPKRAMLVDEDGWQHGWGWNARAQLISAYGAASVNDTIATVKAQLHQIVGDVVFVGLLRTSEDEYWVDWNTDDTRELVEPLMALNMGYNFTIEDKTS